MPSRSAFSKKRFINTESSELKAFTVLDLLGLNTALPSDILNKGLAPRLDNARIYQRVAEKNQVAISTRKGQAEYLNPLGEATDNSYDNTATAGDTDVTLNTTKRTAETFTTVGAGRLTKITLSLKESTAGGTGPIWAVIHADDGGEPGAVMATSSANASDLSASYTDVTFRFIDAPQVAVTTDYWIVVYVQSNGTGSYEWEAHTTGSSALESVNEGGTWSAPATTFKAYYDVHIADDEKILGMARYYKDGSTPETIVAAGTDVYKEDAGAFTSIKGSLSSSATKYRFAEANDLQFYVNGFDAPQQYNGTTSIDITSASPPPVGTICVTHGNRLWIVSAADPNKIVYSNITDYGLFESTSFFYVPAPKTGDPITSVASFQGDLVIGTRDSKYVIYGSSEDDYTLRKSPGSHGVVSHEGQAIIGNYLYTMSDDGVYRYDGSSDVKISDPVSPNIDGITDKSSVSFTGWKDGLRIYYRINATENNRMLLYDTTIQQWSKDTGISVKYANKYMGDSTDPDEEVELMEASDKVVAVYKAEKQNSDLGKPIEYKFWTKYFHMGSPMLRKRIKRFYPIMRAQDEGFEHVIKVDRDERGTPVELTPINMQADGPIWGSFTWGEENWGSKTRIDPRIPVPGSSTSFQFRFEQTGVNTPIEVIGFVMYYKTKKPR